MTRGFALTMVAMVVVGAGACGGGGHLQQPESAEVEAAVAQVEVVDMPQRIELSGTVEADRTSAVSSRVMAGVTAVHVQAGDRVSKGQVLVEIEPDTARGQEAQARGALAQARAALALAERNFERFKVLVEKGAAAQLELDLARMHYEQASGAVEQASGLLIGIDDVKVHGLSITPASARLTRGVCAYMMQTPHITIP